MMEQNKEHNPNFDYYTFSTQEAETKTPSAEVTDTPKTEEMGEERYSAPLPQPTPEERAPVLATAGRTMRRLGLGLFVLNSVWLVAILLAEMLAAFLTGAGVLPESFLNSWQFTLFLNSVPLYLVAFPLYYLVIAKIKPYHPEKKELSGGKLFILLLIAVSLLIAGSLVGDGVMALLSRVVGYEYENALDQMMELPLLVDFLLSVVMAPVMEELIFRKLFLERLAPFGELPAILIVGITFGLWHGNFYQFFYAALMGILLSFVYMRTGRLRYTILFHAIINFLFGIMPTILQNWFGIDAFNALVEEEAQMAYIVEHFLSYLVLSVYSSLQYGAAIAGAVLLIVFWRKFRVNNPMELELNRREYRKSFINVGTVLTVLSMAVVFVCSLIPAAA